MKPALYDAHLHLAASTLRPSAKNLCATLRKAGVHRIVCNGTSPHDWPHVLQLAKSQPIVLPAVGLHPWKVSEAPSDWKTQFLHSLDAGAKAVGEIGLDQWIKGHNRQSQQEAFRFQLEEAALRELPVSIHCLRAVEPLIETLRSSPLPKRGFHLHAYNGPTDRLDELLSLGAYFSFNAGQFKPGSKRILQNLQDVPLDRLFIETDAPHFLPPAEHRPFRLSDPEGNHPAKITAAYAAIASARGINCNEMARQIALNFCAFFGS